MARVRPYYIYMADQVAGGEHFRTMVQTGLEIMQALRGWTSGLAIPYFVIDSPGGGGKVPLLPEYVESITDDEVVFRNYEGKQYRYKQPKIAKDGSVADDQVGPSGYSVIKADSLDEAVELAKGCPVRLGGASVQVVETFSVM